MGIFDWFKNKPNPEKPAITSPIDQSKSAAKIKTSITGKSPADKGFKSEKGVAREAFDKVMQSVDISDEKKEKLFKAFLSAHKAGSPRKEEEAVLTLLSDTE